nr:MAG TPA: hypothetical protein [Caudoviricetes sp.]
MNILLWKQTTLKNAVTSFGFISQGYVTKAIIVPFFYSSKKGIQ